MRGVAKGCILRIRNSAELVADDSHAQRIPSIRPVTSICVCEKVEADDQYSATGNFLGLLPSRSGSANRMPVP